MLISYILILSNRVFKEMDTGVAWVLAKTSVVCSSDHFCVHWKGKLIKLVLNIIILNYFNALECRMKNHQQNHKRTYNLSVCVYLYMYIYMYICINMYIYMYKLWAVNTKHGFCTFLKKWLCLFLCMSFSERDSSV